MSTFEDEPFGIEMTDDELGLTAAARYRQLRHEARRYRRGVDKIIRRTRRCR